MSRLDPIGNLSAMLAKWIMDEDNHKKLVDLISATLQQRKAQYDATFSGVKKTHWALEKVVDYVCPDRTAAVQTKHQAISTDNVVAVLQDILNQGNWVQGNAFFNPSFNTQLVTEMVRLFREDMRAVMASDGKNETGYHRPHLTQLADDFEKQIIVVARDGQKIIDGVKAAMARSQMSHLAFTAVEDE